MHSFTLWFINQHDAENAIANLMAKLPSWRWQTANKPDGNLRHGWTLTVQGIRPHTPEALPGLDGGDLAELGGAFSYAFGHLKQIAFPQ